MKFHNRSRCTRFSWPLFPVAFLFYNCVFLVHAFPQFTAPHWFLDGGQEFAHLGACVSGAGDVNGDGYDDIMVSAPRLHNPAGASYAGAVYGFYGSAAGLADTPDWTVYGDQAEGSFGGSISGAGDVNNDGYDDVIVGMHYYDGSTASQGAIFLYRGSASGLSLSFNQKIDGVSNSFFGYSVAGAGDVNGDGYDDVIVGAFAHYRGGLSQVQEGLAYVYHGSDTGIAVSPDWIGEGQQQQAQYGRSVAGAGDVNGDGFDEVIVGAHQFDNGESNEGRVFVHHGSDTGLSVTENWTAELNQANANFGVSVSGAGDVNGDGYDDVIAGAEYYDNDFQSAGIACTYLGSDSGLSNTPDWCVEGQAEDTRLGNSVAAAGDVNGDGYGDVIVGAHYYDNGIRNEGGAFIFWGSDSGLPNVPNWSTESDGLDARYGHSVSTAGDINNDGRADVIVGADWLDAAGSQEGRAYVYHGAETVPIEKKSISAAFPGVPISLNGAVWPGFLEPGTILRLYDTRGRFVWESTGIEPFGHIVDPEVENGTYLLRRHAKNAVIEAKIVLLR